MNLAFRIPLLEHRVILPRFPSCVQLTRFLPWLTRKEMLGICDIFIRSSTLYLRENLKILVKKITTTVITTATTASI